MIIKLIDHYHYYHYAFKNLHYKYQIGVAGYLACVLCFNTAAKNIYTCPATSIYSMTGSKAWGD